MLIQFNFANFNSFKDIATLDLSATKKTEHNDRVIEIGSERVLPVAAIYGANASGKSNVYKAFEFMTSFVIQSLHYGDDPTKFKENSPTPFLFDSTSKEADSSFEVYFTIPGDISGKSYQYGFCLNKERITEEWLNYTTKTGRGVYKTIFYRSIENGSTELDLSGLPASARKNIEVALDNQVLIVSLGAKLKVEKCKMVRDWFLANEFADFADTVLNIYRFSSLPSGFVSDESVREKIVNYFSSFDESIKGFSVEELPPEEGSDSPQYRINSIHNMIDSNGTAEISLRNESAGTLKMFSMYPELLNVFQKGSVYFVDELNARLHPLLVRVIILAFLNPELNKNHAQLIFTTHDAWQLSNELLRRDEIWFTEKKNGVSTLYSLADFVDEDGSKIRKDESYEKNYLVGKYGAIPTLKTIDIL